MGGFRQVFSVTNGLHGCTTARTTEPTVEPSSRAGMQTETVRAALVSSTVDMGNSAWWYVCGTP